MGINKWVLSMITIVFITTMILTGVYKLMKINLEFDRDIRQQEMEMKRLELIWEICKGGGEFDGSSKSIYCKERIK